MPYDVGEQCGRRALTLEHEARIRRVLVARPPPAAREGRQPEERGEQHGGAEHERRHALQPHDALPSAAASPATFASGVGPVGRALALAPCVLPHARGRAGISRIPGGRRRGEQAPRRHCRQPLLACRVGGSVAGAAAAGG
jgi:hypothetical protein